MASVKLKDVVKKYPGGVIAVSDFNLDIEDKEFIIFVGPSGCGKSTTLRMIAGLEEITEGELYIDGKIMNDVAPKDRDIAMVFQNYALYPHMSVFENMAFGLKLRKTPKNEIKKRVQEAAKILDIEHLLERPIKALSGGQRQRVALGRAIVREPKVFLMDEPLSNLDAKLRVQMRTEISKLHHKLQTTIIYVTHDQTEAMTMGTRIVVMKDGFIQQVDTPTRLYDKPCNVFVAGFIGSPQMNMITGTAEKIDDELYFKFGTQKVKIPAKKAAKIIDQGFVSDEDVIKPIIMGIRAENVHDEQMYIDMFKDEALLTATVDVVERLGAETFLYMTSEESIIVAKVNPRSTAAVGDTIQIALDPNRFHFFDKETERTISN